MGEYRKERYFGVVWNVFVVKSKADGLAAIKRGEKALRFSLSCNLNKPVDAREIEAELRKSSTLLFLDLEYSKIGALVGFIADGLKVNKTLQCLVLESYGIGASGAQSIADALKVNKTLQTLCLPYNNIGTQEAEFFPDGVESNIETLDLWDNEIGAQGAESIADAVKVNKTLQTLDLARNKIGAQGAESIADALKVNKTLQTLSLWDNEIGDQGAESIVDALKVNKTLQTLYLPCNNIGDQGAESIADALKVNKTLQTLDLWDNEIGAQGAESIADALKVNKTLLKLDLWDNEIGAQGAGSIADAVKVNKTLQSLILRNNYIGAQGAESIADALKVNKTLQSLYLRNNNIGAQGAESIADALKVNKTLQSLNLDSNNIGDQGAESIADALKGNKTLQSLSLAVNKIGAQGAESIADALKVNKTLQSLRLGYNNNGIEGDVSIAASASPNLKYIGSKNGKDYTGDARVKALQSYWEAAHRLGLAPQEFVPKEILDRDSSRKAANTIAYLQGLLYSSDSVHQLKVLLVGPQQVGKTSLRRALKSKGKHANPTKSDDADRATISVDVDKISFEPSRTFSFFPQRSKKIVGEISLWDFGGQEEYYMTHAFFLSNRSLVMVVVDLESYVDTDESFENVAGKWLRSLQMQLFRPKVVLVGTKCDTQTQGQIDRKLSSLVKRVDELGLKVRSSIAEAAKTQSLGEEEIERLNGFEGLSFTGQRSFAVSGVDMKSGDGVKTLYKFLRDLASNPDKGLALRVPKAFEDLRSVIKEKLKADSAFIQDVAVLQQEAGLEGKDEMFRLALGLMHDLGIVLWYEKNDQLCDFVFADPSWVVDIVRQVFRHDIFVRKEGSNSKGVLYDLHAPPKLCDLLEKKCILDAELLRLFPLWETFDEKLFGRCLLLLQQFELMFKLAPREQAVEQRDQFMVPLFLQPGFVGEKARTWRESKRFSLSKTLRQSFGRLQNSLTASSWIESTQQVDFIAFLPHGLFFRLIARTHRIAEFSKISVDSADAVYRHVSGHLVNINMKLRENMNGSGVLIIFCRCDSPDSELIRVFERTKDLISNEIDQLMEESFQFVPYISKLTITRSSKSDSLDGQLDVRRSRKASLLVSKDALEYSYFHKKEKVVRTLLKLKDPYTVKKLFIEATEHQLEKADQKTDYVVKVGKDIRGKLKNTFQLNWSALIDGDPLKADLRRFEGRFEGKESDLSWSDAREYLLLVRRLVTRVRTRFDCFMSHKWGEGGSNHEEVKKLADYLGKRGLKCWVDDQCIQDSIRTEMLQGIQDSQVFVACITHDYIEDVKKGERTNCGKEFIDAGNKARDDTVPYFMDEDLSDEAILSVLPGFGGKKYFTRKSDLFDRILQQLFPYDEVQHRESLISMYPTLRDQEVEQEVD